MAANADDQQPSTSNNRFADATDQEMDEILLGVDAKNTTKSTKFAVKLLRDYCLSKNTNQEFENLTGSELDTLLKGFYVNLRRQNGELYNRSSFLVIRQSLNRFLKNPPVNKTFDIISDPEFTNCNAAFKAMCKKMREEGKGKVQHKVPIEKGDIFKLYTHPRVFNTDTPSGLLNKVFFEIMIYFCRRGQENLRAMKPSDFEVQKDDIGRRFVCKVTSERDKNHQGNSKQKKQRREPKGARMYEKVNKRRCPVESFLKYLSKRNPNCDALWQRPKDSYDNDDTIWYDKRPLGKNTLAEMMSMFSKAADLSQIYTNHCIRATCITTLNDHGFEARHIVTVSGHRNEESVKSYCSDTSTKQKRDMSDSIADFLSVSDDEEIPESENLANNENEFENDITEEELVLSASQSDNLDSVIQEIVVGKSQLEEIQEQTRQVEPLADITNTVTDLNIDTNPQCLKAKPSASMMFNNCNVTINMVQP